MTDAVLRVALPPHVMRELVEELVEDVVAYLRGDAPLRMTASLSGLLPGLDESAGAALGNRMLAATTTELIDDPERYEAAVRDLASELAAGRVPADVPSADPGAITRPEMVDAIDAATSGLGLSAKARGQVVASAFPGGERDALITAGADLLSTHLRALRLELSDEGSLQLDLLNYLDEQVGGSDQMVMELESVRDTVRYVPSWSRSVGLFAIVAGAAVILVGLRSQILVALGSVGASAVVGAAAALGSTHVVADRLDSRLASIAHDRSGALPSPVRSLVADVTHTISLGLDDAIWDACLGLAITGLGLLSVTGLVLGIRAWDERPPTRPTVRIGMVLTATMLSTVVVWTPGERSQAAEARECNGHVELCERPYDQVVQAATHISMSSPQVVHVWPEQDAGIRAQLDSRVRVLLIDTSYWRTADLPAAIGQLTEMLPRRLALDLSEFLDRRLESRRGTYLCHSWCAFGAIPLVTALGEVRDFLADNPTDVVTLIIQNGTSTEDTIEAFEASGLDDYLHRGDPGDSWPTLGELVESGQRLVVFAETTGPPPDWYHSGEHNIQDTPFGAPSLDQLSCRHVRGPADAPLFRMNHWIDRLAPDRADAAWLNRRDVIVARARACEGLRGALPSFIVVNFFSLGDLNGAVDELNGLG